MGAAEKSIVDPELVPGEVNRLRRTFRSDKTLSKEWRVGQLNTMLRMMEEGRTELQQAMYKDLHKSPHECDITEIDFTITEISHALRHIDEWMKPHREAISPLNMPGSGAVVYEPLGVSLIMGAWNYPVLLTFAPLVGSIAAGCCAVVKPGSYAPETSHVIAKLLTRYMDLDALVVCEGNRDVTNALLAQRFDMIFFTGSGFVGKLVAKAAAEHLTPVVLELGGKSPLIVDKTADLDLAASRLVWGTFLNSGQTCIRPDFGLIEASVADKFIELCRKKIVEYYSEDVQKSEFFGRVINKDAFERLRRIIESSKDRIVIGGKTDSADKFVEPTILDYGTDSKAFDESPAMADEIFGPIFPMLRFQDFEKDVIERIRDLKTGKPLALYCFTEDSRVAETVTHRTYSGGLCINDTLMHIANADLPFGGVGSSGMGSYHGFRSFKAFSHEKAVLTKYSFLDQNPLLKGALAARYPPYTPARKFLGKVVTNPMLASFQETLDSPGFQRLLLLLLLIFVGRSFGFRVTRD